jgi:nitroimidazol reductase NimA-like FMN-containing flavoprotein (pyridoxamine 5'-phosphate oxidase superfamily)
MRRSDREITDLLEIDDILKRARICNLGLNDNGVPYVVPVNYGYDAGCLYIHSAKEGRKIDILRRDEKVAFDIYTDEKLLEAEKSCGWGMKYRCVMGQGRASLLTAATEKEKALGIIMRQHGSSLADFDPAQVEKVVVIKVEIVSMTGKKARC